MGEFRRDPLTDGWVIVAPDRAGRPDEYGSHEPVRAAGPGPCAFCAGREGDTPAEVASRRGPGGWSARAVPNRYPALTANGRAGDPVAEGAGRHEVIVETPRHVVSLTDLSEGEVADVLGLYRDRLAAVRADARFRYGLVFKNVGAQAGASVEHTHSQLLAVPLVPERIEVELARVRARREERGSCLFCDERAKAVSEDRVVLEEGGFTAFAPWASRVPYEVHVLPAAHAPRFEEAPETSLPALARCLRETVRAIEGAADRPPWNLFVHTAPFGGEPDFHWHIEILPRLVRTAGFEWGSGIHINTVPPEEAARRLRERIA